MFSEEVFILHYNHIYFEINQKRLSGTNRNELKHMLDESKFELIIKHQLGHMKWTQSVWHVVLVERRNQQENN